MLGAEEAANLSDIPNIRQKGSRLGNWLTREQAKEPRAVPDRSTRNGKRDCAIPAVLAGCARAAGCSLISKGREGASEQRRFRCGSSRESMPGGQRQPSKTGRCCGQSPKAGKSAGARATGRSGPSSNPRSRSGPSGSAPTTCAVPAPNCARRPAAISRGSSFCRGGGVRIRRLIFTPDSTSAHIFTRPESELRS